MTKEFKSLKASGLSDEFDALEYGSEPIIQVDEGKDQLSITCIFPGFDLSDDDQDIAGEKKPFKEVGIKGVGFLSEEGKPLLPVFRRFVNIPPGCSVEFDVEKGRAANFEDILVTPSQESAVDTDEEHTFEFDEESYKKDEFFPKEIVKVSPTQDIDGYNAVLVEVCPIRYNAAKRKLQGYSNIKIILKFSGKDMDSDENEFVFTDPSSSREGFGNLLLNPSRTVTRLEEMPTLRVPGILYPWGPEFIIIYHNNFKTAAQKLALWKNTKGISTSIVDISTVGNTTGQIKNFIRGRRSAFYSRLRYVMLLGDTNHIVTENVSGRATDFYYSTPKDPSSNSDCVAPWLAIGRVPVQTNTEAHRIMDQIIRYEKTPPCDPTYYDRMTAAAYFQDDSPQDGKANRAYVKTMESIRSHLVSIGKEVQRVYVSNNPNPQLYKDGSPVPAAVKNAMVSSGTATDMLIAETAEGQLIMGHRDHGGTTGWSHPHFGPDELDAVTSLYPSIFFSINCLTGRFDFSTASDSFAEYILKKDGGAPSLIAATRVSGTWRNDSLEKALFDGIYPGVIPTYPGTTASYAIKNNRLGDLLNYAKVYLFTAHGLNSGVKGHNEIYHVIGDPTLEIWESPPNVNCFTLQLFTGYLQIKLNSAPRSGIVTIIDRGKIIKKINVTSTLIRFPLRNLQLLTPSPARRLLRVCFSAPGYRYIEKRIMI